MRRIQIPRRRIPFILMLIIVPLTGLVCDWNPLGSQGDATATTTPWPASGSLASSTPTSGNFSLEYSREGSLSAAGVSIQWGPDTAVIPLELRDGTYAGSYSGAFKAVVSGTCSGAYTYPVSFDVTATDDGSGGLDFTFAATMSMAGVLSCATGPVGNAPVTFTRLFNLPAADNAYKVEVVPMQAYGTLTDTYTLKTR